MFIRSSLTINIQLFYRNRVNEKLITMTLTLPFHMEEALLLFILQVDSLERECVCNFINYILNRLLSPTLLPSHPPTTSLYQCSNYWLYLGMHDVCDLIQRKKSYHIQLNISRTE